VTLSREPGSFRDPSGFVFVADGVIFRQVNRVYEAQYRQLMRSGLYDELVTHRLLIPHEEVDTPGAGADACAILRPERIPFISYPYEWCFSQMKAAALQTLDIQKRAIAKGMTLRDASAFNVQFHGTRPIFIDTLSLGSYTEGQPWAAYRQFCQHFLGPLALMSTVDPSLNQLTRVHLDGVPLALTARLLPARTRLRPGLAVHVHLHARTDSRFSAGKLEGAAAPATGRGMSKTAMLALVDSLERTVARLELHPARTLWSTYEEHANYSATAHADKQRLVADWLASLELPRTAAIWDVGANTGVYSRLAANGERTVVSFDFDHAAVERHFRTIAGRESHGILPLIQDLTNPSGGLGWRNRERRSLEERGPADVVMALAICHHLVFTGHIPLADVAALFGAICRHLIVEFVPRADSQVQQMLALRQGDGLPYSRELFEEAFGRHFDVLRVAEISETVRTLYLMRQKPTS